MGSKGKQSKAQSLMVERNDLEASLNEGYHHLPLLKNFKSKYIYVGY